MVAIVGTVGTAVQCASFFEVLGFLGSRPLQACPLTKSGYCSKSMEVFETEILQ